MAFLDEQNGEVDEYEDFVAGAATLQEHKDLSSRYICRLAEKLSSAAEVRQSEMEQKAAEAERLRETLQQLRIDLDGLGSRVPKADLDQLRGTILSGLLPDDATKENMGNTRTLKGTSANDKANTVVRRLKVRMERLEKERTRYERENEKLRLQKMSAERDTETARGEVRAAQAALRDAQAAAAAASRQGVHNTSLSTLDPPPSAREPRARSPPAGPRRSPSPPRPSPRGQVSQSVLSEGSESRAFREVREERDKLQAQNRRLTREQAEQQIYADQVVNQLGHALRALEAENAALQEELKQHGLKLATTAEEKKRLERQSKQWKAEKDVLTRQVVELRQGSEGYLEMDELPRPQQQQPKKLPSNMPFGQNSAKRSGRRRSGAGQGAQETQDDVPADADQAPSPPVPSAPAPSLGDRTAKIARPVGSSSNAPASPPLSSRGTAGRLPSPRRRAGSPPRQEDASSVPEPISRVVAPQASQQAPEVDRVVAVTSSSGPGGPSEQLALRAKQMATISSSEESGTKVGAQGKEEFFEAVATGRDTPNSITSSARGAGSVGVPSTNKVSSTSAKAPSAPKIIPGADDERSGGPTDSSGPTSVALANAEAPSGSMGQIQGGPSWANPVAKVVGPASRISANVSTPLDAGVDASGSWAAPASGRQSDALNQPGQAGLGWASNATGSGASQGMPSWMQPH